MTELIALVKSRSSRSQTIGYGENEKNVLIAGILQFYLLHVNSILGKSTLTSSFLDRLCCESFILKIVATLLTK